jgi:serine/threonine protein kinase
MRPRYAVPASMDDLWPLLRSLDLLDDEQFRRLAGTGEPGPVGPHLEQLVHAGVLTAWQVEQILAGRFSRLRLGPYRLLERLGSGRSSRVYKAEHVLMKRLVALKVLGRSRQRVKATVGGGFAKSRRGTRGELETAGRLSHPHVVAAYDAARFRARLVLVMEYVEGIDLERLVNEAGPLPVPLACEVVRQTAMALAYLHERRLVHRDVKPANLLLKCGQSGSGGVVLPDGPVLVKLVDLGLSCRAGEGGAEMCGTLDYIAPERGLAPDAADIRGDLYSLGCTFYQLLTGRVPFPGGSWTGKLLRHRLEVPEPVGELRPEVPADVAAIVDRLMARDLEERYPEPAALLAALDRLGPADLEPVSLPSPGASPSPRPASRRRTMPLALLATILLGGTLGGAARFSLPSTANQEEVAPSPSVARSIVVSGLERSFTDLEEAVAAARDGATLTLHGAGPYRTRPLQLRGKSLTLAAGPGAKPILERLDAPEMEWEALLSSDRPLTLEGLTLRGGEGALAPVVLVEQASLRLRDCVLEGGTTGPLAALRRGRSLEIEGCRLTATTQALAVEMEAPNSCRVSISRSTIEVRDPTGPALLLWSAEQGPPARVEVKVHHSTLRAGRILACRSLAGPIELSASDNRLGFQQGLASFDGYRDKEAWRKVLRWTGQGNRYDAAGPWLRLEGRPKAIASEAAWEQLWTR